MMAGRGSGVFRAGVSERDSEKDGSEETEECEGDEDGRGDGFEEVEAAAQEDDDAEAAGRRERDGGTAKIEETKEDGSVACDRDEEESTPEKGLGKVQE
jgi:hypothetical protein